MEMALSVGLPLPVATDDKHVKYRWAVWKKGFRYCTVFVLRSLLLSILPIGVFFFLSFSKTAYDTQFNKAFVLPPAILNRVLWELTVISAIAVVGEFLRPVLIRWYARCRGRNLRVRYLSCLFMVLLVQIMLLSLRLLATPELVRTEAFFPSKDGHKYSSGAIYSQRDDSSAALFTNVTEQYSKVIAQLVRFEELSHAVGLKLVSLTTLATMTPDEIVKAHKQRCGEGLVSVVIVARDEHHYLERTLHSIANATEPGILREIIVVDDKSEPPMETSYNRSLLSHPLVKVVRNEERAGLIRSKVIGAEHTSGKILVFLDAHVKPEQNWISPIIRHINTNYKRVVVPVIPVLDGDTWVPNHHAVGVKMMFDWKLNFNWVQSSDDWVPCMSGGLLAISRRWWEESGALDSGMRQWGAENIEQSVRVWLCGGEIVVARNSLVAHVFRPSFPYPMNGTLPLFNSIRTVEVWFDDYKKYFYEAQGHRAQQYRPKKGLNATLSAAQEEIFAGVDERLALRKKLQCQPFQTFIDRFENVFYDRFMLPATVFQIRNPESGMCLSSTDKRLIFEQCVDGDASQLWFTRFAGNDARNIGLENVYHKKCLASQTALPVATRVVLKKCDRNDKTQTPWVLEHQRLIHASKCLSMHVPSTSDANYKEQDAVGSTDDEQHLVPRLKYCSIRRQPSEYNVNGESHNNNASLYGSPVGFQHLEAFSSHLMTAKDLKQAFKER